MEKLFTLRDLAEQQATRGKPVSAWLKELRKAAASGQIETLQCGNSTNAPHMVTQLAMRQYLRRAYRLNEATAC